MYFEDWIGNTDLKAISNHNRVNQYCPKRNSQDKPYISRLKQMDPSNDLILKDWKSQKNPLLENEFKLKPYNYWLYFKDILQDVENNYLIFAAAAVIIIVVVVIVLKKKIIKQRRGFRYIDIEVQPILI